MPKFSSVEVLFKRTAEGWTFKAAYPRIFSPLSTFLLTDAQKAVLEQRLNRCVLTSLVLAYMFAGLGFLTLIIMVPDPDAVSPQTWLLMCVVGIVVAIPLIPALLFIRHRAVEPVLCTATCIGPAQPDRLGFILIEMIKRYIEVPVAIRRGRGDIEGADAGKAGAPWLTLALLTALVVVFCIELLAGFDGPTGWLEPSIRTLVALGGSIRTRVVDGGEWYRLISAPFLHIDLIHLALNGLMLLWGGLLLERMLGRAWLAAIYAVSAVTGGLVSLAVSEPSVVSVGASGALAGLMASLFVASFHFPPGPVRRRLRIASLAILVPSLIPVGTSVTGQRIDFGGHLGGALGGALMTLILLGNWPAAERLPRLRRLAAAIGLSGLVAAVVTVGEVTGSYLKTQHEIELLAMLIPNSELPRTDEQMKAKAEALAARYPHDPRLQLFRGGALLDAGDLAGAERELRAGLADAETFKDLLPPRLEALLRTNLAIALDDNRQKAEAEAIAAPVCQLDTAENRPMRLRLKRIGVCD